GRRGRGRAYRLGVVRAEAAYAARWELVGVGGVVVAVDVLRAFTTAAYALAAGASAIWLAGGVEEAVALGRSIPGALVMGEEHGRRPPGFDLSNSPVEASRADVAGRPLVQRTSAGTQGVIAAVDAERVFAASLVCASATAAAVAATGLGAPTYVITGRFPDRRADGPDGEDDLITAELIERARTGPPLSAGEAAAAARAVAASREAEITLAVGAGHVHPDDIAYATAVDRFAFAMEVERVHGRLRLVRRDPPPPAPSPEPGPR
ncbi:MAG TPA: 2-phosphosulfolactate phosphatase, partial [Acidimicrobiales bacterium]